MSYNFANHFKDIIGEKLGKNKFFMTHYQFLSGYFYCKESFFNVMGLINYNFIDDIYNKYFNQCLVKGDRL